MRQFCTALIGAVSLAGCAPTTFTYYKPIGPGSYFKSCGSGPDHQLGFKAADGLGVMIDTGMPAPDRRIASQQTLSVVFRLSDGHTLQLPSPTFELIVDNSNNRIFAPVSEITRVEYVQLLDKRWHYRPVPVPADSVLRGGLRPKEYGSRLYVDFQKWLPYVLKIPVGQLGGKTYTLIFPPMLLDEKQIQIPQIRVEYGTYIHFVTFCS